MTFRPDQVGDKGQRYEIWCNDGTGKQMRIGWSDTPDGFKKVVDLHPSWCDHRAVDRQAEGGTDEASR